MLQNLKSDFRMLKGRDLKQLPLCKYLLPDRVHFGYEWRDGPNSVPNPKPLGCSCREGAFHFTTFDTIVRYMIYDRRCDGLVLDCWLADVVVADDEDVYQDGTHFKAHNVTIGNLRKLSSLSEAELFRLAMGRDRRNLLVPTAEERLWREAVLDCPGRLAFMPQQPPQLCQEIVETWPFMLRHVREPTDELCMRALALNCSCFQWIKQPTLAMAELCIPGDIYNMLKRVEQPLLHQLVTKYMNTALEPMMREELQRRRQLLRPDPEQ